MRASISSLRGAGRPRCASSRRGTREWFLCRAPVRPSPIVRAVRPQAIRYLNRLSDLLFVLARVLARASGHGEVLWNHDRRR